MSVIPGTKAWGFEDRLMSKRPELASKALAVPVDELNEFELEDPFNKGNILSGFISRRATSRYGAIYLDKINGMDCKKQVIWGTPKLHYPFDKNGKFRWPPVKKVNVYTKYDGTNILGYRYWFKDKWWDTYKTRLTPIVRSGKFGDFCGMWTEILEKYPHIREAVKVSEVSPSFELYGARNRHLIVYDTPLDIVLLFGIKQSHEPEVLDVERLGDWGVPVATSWPCTALNDLTSFYKKTQAEAEAANTVDDLGIVGTEGYVFYCHTEDGAIKMMKAKPESIEKIHWASGGISKNVIRATCYNAFENSDDPGYDLVRTMLREEFEDKQIDAELVMIKQVLREVVEDMAFRHIVQSEYQKVGITLADDKRTVMQTLSKRFTKGEMKYVYRIIAGI